MPLKFRYAIFTFMLILLGQDAVSKHIAGGDFTYRRLTGNQFEITLKLFRDCADFVPFDNTILIGVFNKGTNALVGSYTVALKDSGGLTLTGSSCLTPPQGVCMDKCTYVDTITLANNPSGYYISWERCCRNNATLNLNRPGDTGIAYYMEIPDPAIIDNSPFFSTDPFPFMCVGQDFSFDFSATDPDGDVLTYTLETPLAGDLGYPVKTSTSPVWAAPSPGPYASAQWAPGYSLSNITGTSPPMTLNSNTGLMQVKASLQGYYAMAVVVREYRGGVLIGLIRREIEFTVINCLGNTAPQITYENSTASVNGLTFTVYEKDTLCFTIKATDSDSMTLTYTGDIFSGSGITPPFATTSTASGNGTVTSSFCWYTTCNHGRTQPYHVTYKVEDNGCPTHFSSTDSLLIYVLPQPSIPPPVLYCLAVDTLNSSIKLNFRDTFDMPRFIDRFEIFRSVNGSNFTSVGSVDTTKKSFTDNSAVNSTVNNYCYYIRGVNRCGEYGSSSDTICSDNQLNVEPLTLYSSHISGSSIVIQLTNAADNINSVFYIEKKQNENGFSYEPYLTLNGINGDSLEDMNQPVAEKSFCYRITKQNFCNNISPVSNESCSILLTGTSIPLQHKLQWTPYTEWAGGVSSYVLYRKNHNGRTYAAIATLPSTEFEFTDDNIPQDDGVFDYYVAANSDSLGLTSTSNEVSLIQPATVYSPNAFTPNNDGLNDTWLPLSGFIKTYNLKIFNRWGNIVFETSGTQDGWDGRYQGDKAPQGVYFYVITYRNYVDNQTAYKRGTVTLIR